MRLVIDLQGLQTDSRNRGVGRYTDGLTKAMLRGAGRHEIVLALNGRDPAGVRAVRRDFAGLLPPERIRAWQVPEFGSWEDPSERWRNRAAELTREYFLANLDADAVHVSEIFGGFFTDAMMSFGLLGRQPPVGAILYDLTPLRIPGTYIPGGPVRDWYVAKLRDMRRARRWLGISEATRRDGIDFLGLNPDHVVNISAGVDPKFTAARGATDGVRSFVRERHLQEGFILYYGGLETHKNVVKLVEAYAMLPAEVRRDHPLAIVGKRPHPAYLAAIEEAVARVQLTERDVRFLGRVEDSELISLLHACAFSIYPSLMEGFGLPVLEAMSAGAAVLCSNTSCLPEVIGRPDATFDPRSATSIAERMSEVLKDDAFRAELQAYGPERAKLFTWENSARKAIEAYESLHDEEQVRKRGTRAVAGWSRQRTRLAWLTNWPLSSARAAGLARLARTYEVDIFVESAMAASEVVAASAPLLGIETFARVAASYDRVVIDRADAQAWLACAPAVVVRRLDDAGACGLEARLNLLGFVAEPVDLPADDFEGDVATWADEAVRRIEDAHVAAASPAVLARAFAACAPIGAGEAYDRDFAAIMVANRPLVGQPRLLIEVSRAVMPKVRGGIARVTSEIVRTLLASPPPGVQIMPVRVFPAEGRVVRAGDFDPVVRSDGAGVDLGRQEIELQVGDRLLALGLNHELADSGPLLRRLRELGGQAHAVVYDLLPLHRPDWFQPELHPAHRRWFDAISDWDGLVCISRAVADDVKTELRRLGRDGASPEPAWFHLGSDFAEPAHAEPLPELAGRRTILHVSQVWARKGHEQTLNAFETLWAADSDTNYVIVGRPGYGVDGVIKRLRNHPERGRRLHWFEDCDDALLARLYATADGVLVPSEAEGFGLPLIEAIHYERPVLCRDLPVFRELAGDQVRYFEGLDAAALAAALGSWLVDLASGAARPARGVRLLSWQESAVQLLAAIGMGPVRSEPEAAISRHEVHQLSE
jgi:glycosyltransferase involved in cell wall biosynthesis